MEDEKLIRMHDMLSKLRPGGKTVRFFVYLMRPQ
jgi:hypothetical protein